MFGRTYEGTVINGQVQLSENVKLRERSSVLVIVPDEHQPVKGHVYTPHLSEPEKVKDFEMEVEEARDALL